MGLTGSFVACCVGRRAVVRFGGEPVDVEFFDRPWLPPKTILVTAATGGIGLSVCIRLAKQGHSLILVARDQVKLRALTEELTKAYPAAHAWLSVDMTKDASIEEFGQELSARVLSSMAWS